MGTCFNNEHTSEARYNDEETIREPKKSDKLNNSKGQTNKPRKTNKKLVKYQSNLLDPNLKFTVIAEEESYGISGSYISTIHEDMKSSKAQKTLTPFNASLLSLKQSWNLGQPVDSNTVIYIVNLSTGKYLHSHVVKYETGSKQHEVCACSNGSHEYDHWQLLVEQDGIIENQNIVIVNDNEQLKFRHLLTSFNMRSSNKYQTPKSKQQQVSCVNSLSDLQQDDYWRIEIMNESQELFDNSKIRIKHIASDGYLQTNKTRALTNDDVEVVVSGANDVKDIWVVQIDYK